MIAIFWFSAQPSTKLPDFNWADKIVKKAGHMIGYAALACGYWFELEMKKEKRWVAWSLAILFAITDEYHQSFVPGRNATIWDVAIFDNIGALIGLWLASRYKTQQPLR